MPVVVRIAHAGADPRAPGALLLRGRDGALVPLSSVAKITLDLARSLVDHQDGLRRQIVVASPKVADQVGFADSARLPSISPGSPPAGSMPSGSVTFRRGTWPPAWCWCASRAAS